MYAPNNAYQRQTFFEQIESHINLYALSLNNLIISGDFNCCLNSIDRCPPTHLTDTSRSKLQGLIDKFQVYDIWSKIHDKVTGFTYVDTYNKTQSRLDYIFATTGFLHNNRCTLKEPCYKTIDHKLVSTELCVKGNNRGPDYWKFNAELLKDCLYCENVKSLINDVVKNYNQVSKIYLWEMLKVKIKEYTISYCYKRSKNQQNKILELQKQLDSLCNTNNDIELEKVRSELDTLLEKEAKGAFIRAKAEWCDKGEKCSKFFLNLETKRQAKNIIENIKGSNDNILSTDLDIINEISLFYENLFKAKNKENNHEIKKYLENTLLPNKLSKNDKIQRNKPIDSVEIK